MYKHKYINPNKNLNRISMLQYNCVQFPSQVMHEKKNHGKNNKSL